MSTLHPLPAPASIFEMQSALPLPSFGAGDDSAVIQTRLESMRALMSTSIENLSSFQSTTTDTEDLATRLRTKLISFKRMTASIAMHLDPDWRNSLFSTLDRLLDPDDWPIDFELPTEQSFSTFLRMIIYLHPTKRPGIGLSPNGRIIASWRDDSERIVIECFAKDQVRWVLSATFDDHIERAAADVPIHRVPDVIAPYQPEHLFNNGDKILA